MKLLASLILLILIGLVLAIYLSSRDWQTATRDSAGIAPGPVPTKEAVIQVYGADTWGWRGWFAIHTWMARSGVPAKRSGADHYVVYDVVGWRGYYGQSVLRIDEDIPDRYWYGAKPKVLVEHRGAGVDTLIQQVDNAARNYSWQFSYKAFPGLNSNTFTAWIAQQVPDLKLKLPFTAIGSGYLDNARGRN